MKFVETVEIKSPIKSVFKYLSNFKSYKKYGSNVKDARQTSDGDMQVGAQLFAKVYFLGKKIETASEVTDYVVNEKLGYKSTSGPVPTAVQYMLEEAGTGTKLTMHYDVEPGSFFRMEETFLRPRIGQELTSNLANLKKILEARAK